MRVVSSVVLAVISLLVLTVVFGSWYTVDQTQRGVILRNGAVVGTAQPGLGFKTPWIESVEKFYVTTRIATYENMESYSYDQQPAHLKVSVTYHPDPTKITELYSRFATVENTVARTLSPHVAQEIKVVFGQYTAVRAIQERAKLNTDIKSAIEGALDADKLLVIESIQVEDILFSPTYMTSIEQRMLAEVEVQKLRQNAEREKVQAQIVVTQAQAKADAAVAQATAQATATKLAGDAQATVTRVTGDAQAAVIRVTGDAQAAAVKAKGDALRDNPGLVALISAEKWNGQLPSTMLPGSTVPFVSVK